MKLAILDYGSGNLHSVARACQKAGGAGVKARLADNPDLLKDASRLLLPGVCSFKAAMAGLERRGLLEALREAVMGRALPFLGICAGMQIMAEEGEEHGRHRGLGWISGRASPLSPKDSSFRIPHMGWNSLRLRRPHCLTEGLSGEDFYFAHSYRLEGAGEAVLAESDHGGFFAALVARDNMAGAQFHPEKSQKAGLRFLENFLRWNP